MVYNENEKKHTKSFKIKLIVFVAIILITTFGLTYAFFFGGFSQSGESGFNTLKCFDVSFTDSNSINLTKALPIEDEDGLKMEPYNFSLVNNCETDVDYYVLLNVKKDSFNDEYIKISINGKDGFYLSRYSQNTKFEVGEDFRSSYIIDSGTLSKENPMSYDIRLWEDIKTLYEDTRGQSFEAEIKVVTVVSDGGLEKNSLIDVILAKANDESITDYNSGNKGELFAFNHEATSQTGKIVDYRYIGDVPNNYIYLGEDANVKDLENEQNPGVVDDTTEVDRTWRILVVFTVEGEDGKLEQRIKLIAPYFYQLLTGDSNNVEEETEPTNYLNENIEEEEKEESEGGVENEEVEENNEIILLWEWNTIDNNWKNSSIDNLLSNDVLLNSGVVENRGLNRYLRGLFSNTKYYLGGVSTNSSSTTLYESERSLNSFGNNDTFVFRKVGLLYPSDYSYIYGYGFNDSCFQNIFNCTGSNNWLTDFYGGMWLMSPSLESKNQVSMIELDGQVNFVYVNNSKIVNPVVYLRSDLKYASGDGTENNPYKFSM